jgi:uncharacterized RDD family membrane protein YckC
MATTGNSQHSGITGAAGRAALYPVRAAARAWRDQLESVADDVISSPEIAKVIDRALAGPLPEELARSLVRNRVLERLFEELAASGELERLVNGALESPHTQELAQGAVRSEAAQQVVRELMASDAVRQALARQTRGFADDLVGAIRSATARLDRRIERLLGRDAGETPFAGVATRALALATDVVLTNVLFTSVVGIAALIGSLVGGVRPEWLVGALLSVGWFVIAGVYFTLFWSFVGQTPGMRLLGLDVRTTGGGRPSLARSIVRLVGLVLSIVPFFLGFVPVPFDGRRRGLADFMAGTVVRYTGVSAG